MAGGSRILLPSPASAGGPVLWLGAIASALVGSGVLSGRHALGDVVNITSALAVLSFLPELGWGMYKAASRGD